MLKYVPFLGAGTYAVSAEQPYNATAQQFLPDTDVLASTTNLAALISPSVAIFGGLGLLLAAGVWASIKFGKGPQLNYMKELDVKPDEKK